MVTSKYVSHVLLLIVYSSSIYGIWLPLWYLQTLFCPYFFWPLYCLSFIYLRLLITTLVSSNLFCPLFFLPLYCLSFFNLWLLITHLVFSNCTYSFYLWLF